MLSLFFRNLAIYAERERGQRSGPPKLARDPRETVKFESCGGARPEAKTAAPQRQCHRNSNLGQQKRRRGRPVLVPSVPVTAALPPNSLRDGGGTATLLWRDEGSGGRIRTFCACSPITMLCEEHYAAHRAARWGS